MGFLGFMGFRAFGSRGIQGLGFSGMGSRSPLWHASSPVLGVACEPVWPLALYSYMKVRGMYRPITAPPFSEAFLPRLCLKSELSSMRNLPGLFCVDQYPTAAT